jgi:hypothetical protein
MICNILINLVFHFFPGWSDDLQHAFNERGNHWRHFLLQGQAARTSDGGHQTETDGLRRILSNGRKRAGNWSSKKNQNL